MRCENKTFLQNDPGFLQEISSTAVEVGLVSAGISAARLDESVSIALFALVALRDLFSAGRIPARAKAFASFQRAPDPVFPRAAPPAPRIPAPLHDGNRRIGTAPPANQFRQKLAQRRAPRPRVASRASPACPSAVLRPASRTVHAWSWYAVPGYRSPEPAALPGAFVPEAGSRSLTCLHRKNPAVLMCALV